MEMTPVRGTTLSLNGAGVSSSRKRERNEENEMGGIVNSGIMHTLMGPLSVFFEVAEKITEKSPLAKEGAKVPDPKYALDPASEAKPFKELEQVYMENKEGVSAESLKETRKIKIH